uniref:RING-type E3 ubiquitin transferase n=1 Tax=Terrapene triunguis TaxID=2587831 RepID=A0A674K1P8_9SAUR
MASPATAGDIKDDAICSICLGYLTEPVTIACGHNFCRACITQYCEQWGTGTPLTCPQCRAQFQKGEFKPNTQLNNIVQKLQQLGLKPGKGQKEKLCERHEERLKLFCEEDGETICLVCEKSRDHKSHTVVPIEEAAQEYKVGNKLQGALGPLRKELEKALALTSKEKKETTEWQRKVKNKREMIADEFNKLHALLREEEQMLLQSLEEEERETLQRLQENVTKLSQQSSSLQQLITELEEKCEQPVIELLTVRWHQNSLSSSRIITQIHRWPKTLCCIPPAPGTDSVTFSPVDVTLDPDTANPWLNLSEDRKCVRLRSTRQDLPDNSERFDPCVCVLGTEGFMGGRRYWEVEVGDKTRWALGICRKSVRRKGLITPTPADRYWVVWLSAGEYKALTSPWVLPVSVRPSRVGIFLDYEAGEVSFYNVTDRSHLFTFIGTFSGTLRPFFCPSLSAGGKNVAPLIICPVPAQARAVPDSVTDFHY